MALGLSLLQSVSSAAEVDVFPTYPCTGDTIRIRYRSMDGPLASFDTVYLHWGINGWHLPPGSLRPPGTREFGDRKSVDSLMRRTGRDEFAIEILGVPPIYAVNFVFRNESIWDNNAGRDWTVGMMPSGLKNRLPDIHSPQTGVSIRTETDPAFPWDSAFFPEMSASGVTFRFPDIGQDWIELSGSFWDWKRRERLISKNGVYAVTVPLTDGAYQYKFRLPRLSGWLPDPNNPEMVDDGHAGFNSAIRVMGGRIDQPRPQKLFDRKSESARFVIYWNSIEFSPDGMMDLIERAEGAFPGLARFLESETATRPVIIHYRKGLSANADGVTVGNRIYITRPAIDPSLLVHELTHALRLGRSSVMSEGLATCMDSIYSGTLVGLHLAVRDALAAKTYLPIRQIFYADFINNPNVHLCYTESGSFLAWLLDQHGMPVVLRLCRGESFESIFGTDLQDLERQYTDWILASYP